MNLTDYLRDSSLGVHLVSTFPILLLTSTLFLIVYNKIARHLFKGRKTLTYILFRSIGLSSFVFVWIYIGTVITFHRLDIGLFDGAYRSYLQLDTETNTKLFFTFFTGFAISSLKRFMLKGMLFDFRIKRRNLSKIGVLFYMSLFLWFAFLTTKGFIPNKRIALKIQQALSYYTLWCLVLMLAYLTYTISNHYSRRFAQRKQYTFYVLSKGITWPVIVLVLGLMVLQTSALFIESENIARTHRYFSFACALAALFRLIGLSEKQFLDEKRNAGVSSNKTVIQGLGNVGRIILGVFFAITVVTFFSGNNMVDLGTILGGTGLGIAVAAQPIIANYFGGLILYAEGNFKVGDMICFTEKNIEGFIEDIGPRSIAIRTFDKQLVFVPNAWFSSESITNISKMTHRRILQKIPVGWITKLETLDNIVQDIRMMVNSHPGVDKTQLLMVHFTGFTQQGLEITIYAFTKTKSLHTSRNVQENILRESKAIIEQHAGSPPSSIFYRLSSTKQDPYV